MKFDVVVGNPPYFSPEERHLYSLFVSRVDSAEHAVMLTPAGWCFVKRLQDLWLAKGLKAVTFLDSNSFFKTAKIRSGLTVSVFHKDYTGTVLIKPRNGPAYIQQRDQPIQHHTLMDRQVMQKLNARPCISPRVHQGDYVFPTGVQHDLALLCSKAPQYSLVEDADHPYKVLAYVGGDTRPPRYVWSSQLQSSALTYTVAWPQASDLGLFGKPRILPPGQGSSTATWYVICTDSEEAELWCAWLEHPLVRFCAKIHKTNHSQTNHSNCMQYVPLPPKGDPYAYFGLTEGEIQYVESKV